MNRPPRPPQTASDSAFRAQEELLFRTAARLKGLLFYRAVCPALLLAGGWFYRDVAAVAPLFWTVLALLVGFNLFTLVLGFRGSARADGPVRLALVDAFGYATLAAMTGGPASVFVFLFPLLVMYSAIWFDHRVSVEVGALAVGCVLLLQVVWGNAGGEPGARTVAVLLVLVALTMGAAAIADLVAETRDRMVRAAMDLILANRKVEAQQAELQESEARLRLLLDTTAEAIVGVDPEGNCIFANRACVEMLGYRSEDDLLGRSFHALAHHTHPDGMPYPKEQCRVRRATAAGQSTHCDSEVHWRADGSAFPVEYWSHPIRRNGRLTGTVITFIDITERKRAEEALRRLNLELEERVAQRTSQLATSNAQLKEALAILQRAQEELVHSEKLASLGSLVAGVAHELSSPLGNSLTVATTLGDRTAEFAREAGSGTMRRAALNAYVQQAQQAVTLLTRNLTQAGELIADFKQVAVDQTSAQRRSFDLAEVVQEVVATLQPQFKKTPHRIELAIPSGLAMDSFPGPLGQILSNLVTNALVHGFAQSRAGVVRVEAALAPGDTVMLAVSDNGSGIAPENLPRIFDPFFTTRLGQGGSGLGLHIVYNLVSRVLGGRISVASKPGEGACFALGLPLVAPEQPASGVWESVAVSAAVRPLSENPVTG